MIKDIIIAAVLLFAMFGGAFYYLSIKTDA